MNIANAMIHSMRLVAVNPKPQRQKLRRKTNKYGFAVVSVAMGLVLIVGLFINMVRPLPYADIRLTPPQTPQTQATTLAWPGGGQAAIAAEDYGMLSTYGTNTPLATASIAKVITALCVLQKYPLAKGQAGPTITLGKRDVALYQEQLQQNGSNVPVYDGETITEYEALEALLIPSANNIADSLAIWAFGTLENYTAYANTYVQRHGLVKTHIGSDASGYDPSTVSTASDLAQLGLLARSEPVVMEIASKKSTVLPFVGRVTNYNAVLGAYGINGLKTGNNDQNRGALLFTADIVVAGKTIQISGAVLGQDSLPLALQQSAALVASIAANFEHVTYVHKGDVVGTAKTAWGETAKVVARSDIDIIRWKSQPVITQNTIHTSRAMKAEEVGALSASAGQAQASTALEISVPVRGPSYWWRATRV